jgi:hypothetical protein
MRTRRSVSLLASTVFVHGVVSACARPPATDASGAAASTQTTDMPATAAAATPTPATTTQSSTSEVPESGVPALRPDTRGAEVAPARLAALVRRNSSPAVSLPETLLAARIREWRARSPGERVALWANLFATRNDNTYCFGPKPGCYVGDSLLVQDYKLDCVSLFYRCNELARADSPRDAILLALSTRFASGMPDRVVAPSGAVDYDDASHLDYSEDFAAAGFWGRDATREVGDAIPDAAGTSRYPPGSRWFIPKDRIRFDRLRDGDLLLFVLDETNAKAQALRRDYGLLVGHQALADVDGEVVYQIHAAQSPLSGVYEGNRVVRVPLGTYLQRVERFKGIMVVRPEANGRVAP